MSSMPKRILAVVSTLTLVVLSAGTAQPQALVRLVVKDSGWKRGVCADLTSSPKLAIALLWSPWCPETHLNPIN